ncbi:hypothetical protein C6W96_19010 [Streptomyces sp. CS149]|nr:hypothetical protein C6W96_19010 [Streptomyces sp. CS149]
MRCCCTTSLPTVARPHARGASLSYALVAALGFTIAWSLSKGAGRTGPADGEDPPADARRHHRGTNTGPRAHGEAAGGPCSGVWAASCPEPELDSGHGQAIRTIGVAPRRVSTEPVAHGCPADPPALRPATPRHRPGLASLVASTQPRALSERAQLRPRVPQECGSLADRRSWTYKADHRGRRVAGPSGSPMPPAWSLPLVPRGCSRGGRVEHPTHGRSVEKKRVRRTRVGEWPGEHGPIGAEGRLPRELAATTRKE